MAKKQRKRPAKKTAPAHTRSRSLANAAYIAGLVLFLLILVVLVLTWRHSRSKRRSREQTVLSFPPPAQKAPADSVKFDDFVGAEACAECHQEQYRQWRGSTHGRAGGEPGNVRIFAKFDGKPRFFKDAQVIPYQQNGQYFFRVKQSGFPEQTFRVDAVVGGGHMYGGGTQTFFSRFADGTLRFLPFDFILKEGVWFGETRDRRGWVPISRALSIRDLSEWPPSRILGGEPAFKNCQECHGSQIQTTYDRRRKTYVTRYRSLRINCESCHGPGRRHVQLMRQDSSGTRYDIGMVSLAVLSKDASITVCSRCHALKDQLLPGYLPGKDLQTYYSLKLPMLGRNPYHADGRIKAFGYQQNHLFSDCYLNGSMTCVDCHDPHSQKYRDVWGRPLVGKFDNGQCTGCHASKAIAPEAHSHHKKNSPGNQCTACHMPFLQHKAMGKVLRFARSDHTIPIPRPAFDARLGIENACKQCHADRSLDWLENKMKAWYGTIKPHKSMVRNLLEQEQSDRRTAAQKLLEPAGNFIMAQAAGLARFLEFYLSPNMPALEPEITERLKELAMSTDVDIRALALAALHLARGDVPQIRAFLIERLKQEGNTDLPLRLRWSIILGYLGTVYRDTGKLAESVTIYQKALEILPDHEPTLTNLGYTYQYLQDHHTAIEHFRQAAALKPDDPMPLINMGISLEALGRLEEAKQAYLQAIDVNPWQPLAYFNLGNLYYREQLFSEAARMYRKAAELDPSLARAHFYLARSLIRLRRFREALQETQAGLQYEPDNGSARQMLADLRRLLRQ